MRLKLHPMTAVAFHARVAPARNPARRDRARHIDGNGCRHLGPAAPDAAEGRPHRPVLAQGVPGRALRPARAHRAALGLRRPRPHRPARRQRAAAAPLAQVFRKLYALRFPIRHMQLRDLYVPDGARPADNDISGSFECRQAVPSPCTGGKRHRHVVEPRLRARGRPQPGREPLRRLRQERDKTGAPYLDRSHLRPGMVTPAVVAAFASIGWGWGGSWAGSTKDYMHFSAQRPLAHLGPQRRPAEASGPPRELSRRLRLVPSAPAASRPGRWWRAASRP